jgi:hypothetical protein
MFFVPLISFCLLLQVSLCLKSEALSKVRVTNILRACKVSVGAMLVDISSAWIAVAFKANSANWKALATGVQIGLLVLVTGLNVLAAIVLLRIPRILIPNHQIDPRAPDWIGDVITVAKMKGHWFGPIEHLVISRVIWIETVLLQKIRRHPIIAAIAVSSIFGAVVFGWEGYREGYFLSVTLLVMGLGFCGMFAFLVPAGVFLGLVTSANPSYGMRRRLVDASVVASGITIVTLAFRGKLWGIVGTNGDASGIAPFAQLEGMTILLAFVITLLLEISLGTHARATH